MPRALVARRDDLTDRDDPVPARMPDHDRTGLRRVRIRLGVACFDSPPEFGRLQNRPTRYGAGSMWGGTPVTSSATSWPVAGAIERPSMLCPAAMTTFSYFGLWSMIGKLSYVMGRQPNHS